MCGRWLPPGDQGVVVRDATTGEAAYEVPPAGLEPATALEYARRVGGPALRRLCFPDRADLLKQLARRLREHEEGFVHIAGLGGATPDDVAHDLEAGLAALRRCGRVGTREFPDGNVVALADSGQPSRDGRVAQRLGVVAAGVAVQVNGFSLPLRTMLDKFGQGFVAGMPSVILPSNRTAAVAAALVKQMLDSKLLPEGAVQLLCGSVDLLEHLTAQDLVAFSGSPAAAGRLRAQIATLAPMPRTLFVTETSSSTVLGLDLEPDADALGGIADRLVDTLVRCAGQTSAAVRKVIVPERLADEIAGAVAGRMAEVGVGHPSHPGVRMGPLIDIWHRDRVREQALALSRSGRIVFGIPDKMEILGADPRQGAFMSPALVAVSGPALSAAYENVAFGPVCALLSYRSYDELADLMATEYRSSWGCVITGDAVAARELLGAMAPLHRQMRLLDPDDGARLGWTSQQTDDAACLRGILRHLSPTTVEAGPGPLGQVTGRWVRGAERVVGDPHPLRRYLDELSVGDSVVAGPRVVTREDIARFADLTGDTYYLHTDEEAARSHSAFGGIIAHGYLVMSLAAGMFITPEPGPVLANYGIEDLRFLAPVRPGDALTVTLTAKQITPRPGGDSGKVRWDVDVRNQAGRPVLHYDLLTLIAGSPARPTSA